MLEQVPCKEWIASIFWILSLQQHGITDNCYIAISEDETFENGVDISRFKNENRELKYQCLEYNYGVNSNSVVSIIILISAIVFLAKTKTGKKGACAHAWCLLKGPDASHNIKILSEFGKLHTSAIYLYNLDFLADGHGFETYAGHIFDGKIPSSSVSSR